MFFEMVAKNGIPFACIVSTHKVTSLFFLISALGGTIKSRTCGAFLVLVVFPSPPHRNARQICTCLDRIPIGFAHVFVKCHKNVPAGGEFVAFARNTLFR